MHANTHTHTHTQTGKKSRKMKMVNVAWARSYACILILLGIGQERHHLIKKGAWPSTYWQNKNSQCSINLCSKLKNVTDSFQNTLVTFRKLKCQSFCNKRPIGLKLIFLESKSECFCMLFYMNYPHIWEQKLHGFKKKYNHSCLFIHVFIVIQ